MPAPDDPHQNGVAILFSSVEDEVRHAASRRSCVFENASINFAASIPALSEKTELTQKTLKIDKIRSTMPQNHLKTPKICLPLAFLVRDIWQSRPLGFAHFSP